MMGRCLQCPVLSPAAVVRLPAGGGGRADSEALPASVAVARRTCPGVVAGGGEAGRAHLQGLALEAAFDVRALVLPYWPSPGHPCLPLPACPWWGG